MLVNRTTGARTHEAGGSPSLGPDARRAHDDVVAVLRRMHETAGDSCMTTEFRRLYHRFLDLLNTFQQLVLIDEGRRVSCREGCAYCCCHYVEDVNSFEAQIIAAYVLEHYSQQVVDIRAQCEKDVTAISRLDEITGAVVDDNADAIARERAQFDRVDLLLAGFYQLRRPCPLLDSRGRCLVYPVRPITCRIYVSFSDPQRCRPEHIQEGDAPTALLDLEEEANSLLDDLHFRFDRHGGDTGLRSLLLACLRDPV